MKNPKVVLSRIAHFSRLKSFLTSAALILSTLTLLVMAATSLANAQTYTVLYNFDGKHGAYPSYSSVLAQGRDGNLYGTTPYGGSGNVGVVIKITPTGRLTVLHNFDNVHGSYPASGLTLATSGNFYGTTTSGGGGGKGTIFRTNGRSLTTLHSFAAGTDGGNPYAAPIQGTDGDFYGTTGLGTAYKITSSGSFTALTALPGASFAPLLQATDGKFYGPSYFGGKQKKGTIFEMTPKGIVKLLYDFSNRGHGSNPIGPVIQGYDGNFYGTTEFGGRGGSGVAFKLTPQGSITLLHIFGAHHPSDGQNPYAGLVQATDGNLYGATDYGGTGVAGVIFRITPAGTYSILYNLDTTHGALPDATPMQHTNGKIYGLTYSGGIHEFGVVYSLDLGLAPFVSLVSTWGKVGKTVEILGQGFIGTTAVSFNGTAATFTVVSDTYLTTTVPTGATTGFVTVTTPGGTLTSNKQFRMKP